MIASLLTTRSLGRRIELHNRIDSTNRAAVGLAHAGADHGTLVLADAQTEGRGRLSRKWFSPPDVNLYGSIIVRTAIDAEHLPQWLSWLPLIVALATAEAIEAVTSASVAVKWPNDLLLAERKIGGILCESGTTTSGLFQVLGIGLNVNGAGDDLPEDLRATATTIRHETGRMVDRNRLIAWILQELEACLDEYVLRGSERISLAYRQRCSTIGKLVRAMLADGNEFTGLAEDIGHDGSLTVVRRSIPPDRRASDIRQLRAADIIHLK